MALSATALLEFVRQRSGDSALGEDTPLFSSGALDSVNQLNLIMFVESGAGITVSPADVTLENFDCVRSILDYVSRELGET